MAKKKDIDINIDSTEVKTKKSNLYDDIKDFLSEKDITDFVVMAIKEDSDELDGISLMTSRDKQFSPATLICLARVMADLIANKVGFVAQIKTDGNDMEQRLVKTFAQTMNEFSWEFLSAVVSDLTDDADLKIRLLNAMVKSDPGLHLLRSQVKAKERTEMYCNGDCCDDCLEKACSKLAKAMAKLESDDDDDDNGSDDEDAILEKLIKNI